MSRLPSVVFFGSPEIALPTLEFLAQGQQCQLVHTVTQPSRPIGREQKIFLPPVGEFCRNHSLPFSQSENINIDESLLQKLSDLKPDIFLVFAFSQFLKSHVLNLPKLGCFNIHTSLLPKYRGAAPIQYALLNGDSSTGVSIQKMVKKMDAGDVCTTVPVDIGPDESASSLTHTLSLAARNACEIFLTSLNNQTLKFSPQDESGISFAPIIQKESGRLSFDSMTAKECLRKLRAFDPWPGIHCYLNGKRLKILSASLENSNLAPGGLDVSNKMLVVGCKENNLRLKQVQLEGKKPCSDIELLNGLRGPVVIS